jgi:hypothetical protein
VARGPHPNGHKPGGSVDKSGHIHLKLVTTRETGVKGISPARSLQALEVTAAQFGVPNLVASPAASPTGRDRIYRSNERLWDALMQEQLRASMIIQLPVFCLSEWFPLRPGLFYTPAAGESRGHALRQLLAGPGKDYGARDSFERWFGRPISVRPCEASWR